MMVRTVRKGHQGRPELGRPAHPDPPDLKVRVPSVALPDLRDPREPLDPQDRQGTAFLVRLGHLESRARKTRR